MTVPGIIVSIAALVIGAVVGYLLARQSRVATASAEQEKALSDARLDASTARAEASRAREEVANARSEIAAQLTDKAELRTAVVDAQRETAEVRTELARAVAGRATAEAERDSALRLTDELKADRAAMEDRFKLISTQSLDAQSAKADKTASERMAATQQLVTPLAEHLKQLNDRLGEVEKQRASLAAELREQVQAVKDSGETIRREALSLSNALRTPQVRGSWGEHSLRRIVEISGLTARCDFDDQTSYTSADGDRFRPDMRINLADGKVVFVDSKVPLKAVLDAYNTEDDVAQTAHLATFSRHVRGHIDALSGKNYWHLDVGSPEFVVLFLGSDEFYRLALEQQPDLHDYAARKNVMLACPGTLIPLLHIVAHGWKQAALAESAAKVSKIGRELHERIATMGEHFDKLGRSINSTVTNFNKAVGTLETRVMVSARKLKELDVVNEDLKEIPVVDASVRELSVPEMVDYQEGQQQQRALEASLFEDEPDLSFGRVRELRRTIPASATMDQ
ncbi:DNA recombination protein RmuC [Tessaracoccus sp. OS52]|uniref:DNA recombination protein RmuC n=1 Tax=Tessaracoccus sp. OS52 TaxID=2886691 RepID=UPI001D108F6C|nr:DNA recombination protein RmuC [Tessaracoccus sp. OS52]MCC2593552.1 DNA recombination protein RmuC [Tessaracoccus sp. OS52]